MEKSKKDITANRDRREEARGRIGIKEPEVKEGRHAKTARDS